MKNVKLTIEYDGTNYHGWQSQLNAKTVQQTIEKTIKRLTGEEITIEGSSRTDQGVHAYGQVANFFTESSIPYDRFSHALNSMLPRDIVIKKSEEVSMDFHARRCSKGKKYRYLIYNSSFPSAILRNKSYHISHNLDLYNMGKAIKFFVGRHDFSAFRTKGSDAKIPVRTIFDVNLTRDEDNIWFEVSGSGFLYNMVRIMVGTLIDVGMGRKKEEDIPGILESLDRKKAGKTAPPQGLYLVEVFYENKK